VSVGVWIGLAAIIVAVVGIAVSVFAARRWGNRRRKILFSWSSAPLLPPGHDDGLLEVTYRDFKVKDPHLVTFRVTNVGPSDIASQHFDAGKPLTVVLNCVMYGVTSSSHGHATVSRAIGADGVIDLRPTLLRRGDEWAVEIVVEGEARPTLESSLIDTDVVEGPSVLQQLAEQLVDVAVTISLPFGVRIQLKR
jgi:hypothetical protein